MASKLRILVADNNVDFAKSLARLLHYRGYQLETVYDGKSAIAAACAFQPAVVILDIDLPEIDGCEVAAQLRCDPVSRQCLMIALSGYDQEEDRMRGLEAGCDFYVPKPIDLETLYGLLVEHSSQSGSSIAGL